MNERFARRTIPFIIVAALVAHVTAATPSASLSPDCLPPSPGVLPLYVVNEASAPPQTLNAAMLETSEIWATAGLHLAWVFPPAPLALTDSRTVVVVIQRGLERPSIVRAVPSKHRVLPLLGQVAFGEDGPGNLIQVSFEAITSLVMGSTYLNTPVAKLPDFLQRVLLGRALGRVVAHEIGHWLVGRGHLREGLMRPAFGDRDLVEWRRPRLPRAWTTAGGVLLVRSSRCESTAPGD